MWTVLSKYATAWTEGLATTLWLSGLSLAMGIPLGIALGYWAARNPRGLGNALSVISFLIAGTPVLVILLWLHYPLQAILGVNVPPIWTALFTLTMVLGFSVSEAARHVIITFPTHLILAARNCGLPPRDIFWHISLPIAVRQMLPALLAMTVATIHGTLFASMISVDEALRTAQRINAAEYRPIEIYTALGILFWILCLPLHAAAKILARRSSTFLTQC
jgi:polar amino acid transport system permease protein